MKLHKLWQQESLALKKVLKMICYVEQWVLLCLIIDAGQRGTYRTSLYNSYDSLFAKIDPQVEDSAKEAGKTCTNSFRNFHNSYLQKSDEKLSKAVVRWGYAQLIP